MLSESILINRSGNFTASENHKLMAGWDKPDPPEPYLIDNMELFMTYDKKPLVREIIEATNQPVTGSQVNEMWSYIQSKKIPQGLITYAEEKAMEELFYHDPSLNFSTIHTRNGDERELECMNRLSFETDLDFDNIGDNQKHISINGVGATPDGVVRDKNIIVTGAEVKCKSALVHAKNLLIENNEDLRENEFEHYVQIQTQMLVTNTDHWYFANFNPFAKKESMKFKYIIIGRDNDFIEILNKRLEIAKKIKAEFLNKFSSYIN